METGIDRCLGSDFVGSLHRTVGSPWTQMSDSDRCAAIEPAPITFSGLCCVRDAGDFATPCPDPDGKTGRAETSGVRLRTVCNPANSRPDAAYVE